MRSLHSLVFPPTSSDPSDRPVDYQARSLQVCSLDYYSVTENLSRELAPLYSPRGRRQAPRRLNRRKSKCLDRWSAFVRNDLYLPRTRRIVLRGKRNQRPLWRNIGKSRRFFR